MKQLFHSEVANLPKFKGCSVPVHRWISLGCRMETLYLHPAMGKADKKDLLKFLKPFPDGMQEIVLTLRDFVWDLYPHANELIYDNYNALAFGWSPTDRVGHTFCSMAVGRTSHNIHFGFYWGAELDDPKKLLMGEGNQYRYILVTSLKAFPKAYIRKLMKDAFGNSLAKVKDPKQIRHGETITKSVSPVKRTAKKSVKKKK
jgi:Domain of unknown function (DU1801)